MQGGLDPGDAPTNHQGRLLDAYLAHFQWVLQAGAPYSRGHEPFGLGSRQEWVVVDLSLFRHRGFLVGTVLVSLFFAAFVVSGVVYPMWTQTALGYTATASGVAMAPTSLLPLFMMPLVGQRLARVDKRPVILLGALVMSGVMFGQAWAGTDATFGDIALSRFLIGLGMPLMWMPLMMATLMGLPAEKTASATGMFNFMRMAGSSMGTALAVTVWDERTIVHRSQLVELLSRGIPEIDSASGLLAARLADPQGSE